MCGICGVSSQYKQWSFNLVGQMVNQMDHRGPNDRGFFQDPKMVLGHTRLSIIDLSYNGHQPMFSNDENLVVVFNGEIYNYDELHAFLHDYPFQSRSDTEIILALYQKYEDRCVDYLKGIFSFAIWDREQKKLFAARDHLGVKPFYYYWDNHTLIFSSELRPILDSGVKKFTISHESLAQYMAYATVVEPNTLVKDIYTLPAGSSLYFNDNNLQIKTYWTPGNRKIEVPDDYNRILKDIRGYFIHSVTDQTRSDVPLGIFLSGGIDSTSIAAILSREGGQKIKTFTVAFHEKEYDESDYAKYISKIYGTDHTELFLSPPVMLDMVYPALEALDHPSGDGFNSYIISNVTKRAGITVALSGLGGDEIFNGYYYSQWIYDLYNKSRILKFPLIIRKMAASLNNLYKRSYSSAKLSKMLSHKDTNIFDLYSDAVRYIDSKKYEGIIRQNGHSNYKLNKLLNDNYVDSHLENQLLGKISQCDLFFYLKNILLRDIDQMSMANSLEVRVPFLDYEMIDYVLKIKDTFKVKNGKVGKNIFLDAISNYLPEDLKTRKKTGFNLPMSYWIKNDLFNFSKDKIDHLKERIPEFRDVIQESWNKLFIDSSNNPADDLLTTHIWSLVTLEYWLDKYGLELLN